jgi:hypothetical protein
MSKRSKKIVFYPNRNYVHTGALYCEFTNLSNLAPLVANSFVRVLETTVKIA